MAFLKNLMGLYPILVLCAYAVSVKALCRAPNDNFYGSANPPQPRIFLDGYENGRFACLVEEGNGNLIPGSTDGWLCYYVDAYGQPQYSVPYKIPLNQPNYGWVLISVGDSYSFPTVTSWENANAVVVGQENGNDLFLAICHNIKDNGYIKNVAGKVNRRWGDRAQISGGGWTATCDDYWLLVCY